MGFILFKLGIPVINKKLMGVINMSTRDFPHDKGIDHTLEVLLKEGYKYILNKKQALNTNVFATRLLR